MVFTPYKDDRHFSAEGHALFAKFLTDAEVARAAVDYTNSPIAIFGRLAFPFVRSTIDRIARSQFDIVNATYLGVRAFAERGPCRRRRLPRSEISGRAQLRFRIPQIQDLYVGPEPVHNGTKNADSCGYE